MIPLSTSRRGSFPYDSLICLLSVEFCCAAYFCFLTYIVFSDGREIAVPFEKLPSRRELPDYYEVIENPMDFNRIKKKIRDGKYSSVQDMGKDVKLLCENARVRLSC